MTSCNFVKVILATSVLVLGGCSSWFFPDFDEDKDIVVDDGGKVEMRKVEKKGILIGDKTNALYEDSEQDTSSTDALNNNDQAEENSIATTNVTETEKVTPVQVAPIKSEKIDNVKFVESTAETPQTVHQSTRYLAGVIYFANGSAGLSSDDHAKLKKISQTAKQNKAYVEIYGFASSRTRNTDPVTHKLANFNISAKRAEATAKALRSFGVNGDSITTQALSDSVPAYQEVMPEGERLNRRAEIYLTY